VRNRKRRLLINWNDTHQELKRLIEEQGPYLSALPRMLCGFDDPAYRRSGARHYKIADPALFSAVLNQARLGYNSHPFDEEAGSPAGTG
jgi:hypothetical protein